MGAMVVAGQGVVLRFTSKVTAHLAALSSLLAVMERAVR